jgi:hypothetical protein
MHAVLTFSQSCKNAKVCGFLYISRDAYIIFCRLKLVYRLAEVFSDFTVFVYLTGPLHLPYKLINYMIFSLYYSSL